jgi:hypothetical protein
LHEKEQLVPAALEKAQVPEVLPLVVALSAHPRIVVSTQEAAHELDS